MIKLKFGSVLLLCATMALPAYVAAQDDEGPSYFAVRTVTTNADGLQTWIEQQRQMAERRKEVGAGTRHVWQEVNGDIDTFHIVSFPDSFATFDEPPGEQLMGDAQEEWGRITGPTVDSRSTMTLRHYPGLSIPAEEGSEPNVLVLRRTSIAPGQNGAYQAWLRDKLVPALKAGGATGVNFNRVAYGGDTNLWVSGSRLPNFAALDGDGPLGSLSDEERNALFEGTSEMVWGSERVILRFREDLSNDGPEE